MARSFVFPRPRVTGLLGLSLDTGEVTTAGAFVAFGVLWAVIAPGIVLKVGGGVLVSVAGVALVALPWRNRTPYRWVEVMRTHRALERNGTTTWRNPAPERGFRVVVDRETGQHTSVPVGAEPPPGLTNGKGGGVGFGGDRSGLSWLTAPTDRGDIALVYDRARRVVTAAVEIEAEQAMGMLDTPDQEAVINDYETLLAGVANSLGKIKRLAAITRCVPGDPFAHQRYLAGARIPPADRGTLPPWLFESYDMLTGKITPDSMDQRTWCVASIPVDMKLSADAKRYGSMEYGLGKVIGKEIDDLILKLDEAKMRVVRPLDEERLAAVIYTTYQPDRLVDDSHGLTRATCWPARVDPANPKWLRTLGWGDGLPRLHATAWWMSLPQVPAGVNFLSAILLGGADYVTTTAVVMEMIPTERAMGQMLETMTMQASKTMRGAAGGRVADPRERLAAERMESAAEDVATNAAGVRLTGWTTVSVVDYGNEEEAERDILNARTAAERQAALSQIRLEWCDYEHQRAITNVLPLARGLRLD